MKTLEQCIRETIKKRWPYMPEEAAKHFIEHVKMDAPSVKLSEELNDWEAAWVVDRLLHHINTTTPKEAGRMLKAHVKKN